MLTSYRLEDLHQRSMEDSVPIQPAGDEPDWHLDLCDDQPTECFWIDEDDDDCLQHGDALAYPAMPLQVLQSVASDWDADDLWDTDLEELFSVSQDSLDASSDSQSSDSLDAVCTPIEETTQVRL